MEKLDNIKKVSVHNKLITTILASFLAIALLPMLIVGIISYNNTYKVLLKDAGNSLASVVLERKIEIDTYFNTVFKDLKMQSEMDSNTNFLLSLSNGLKKCRCSVAKFVKSYQWAQIVHQKAGDINKFRRVYGYHDIFFIDAQGNILYTVAKENDLGTNLFSGKYSTTNFATACKKALKTGHPVFSTYESYAPSKGVVSGFLIGVIIDDKGNKIGLIAFQEPITRINRISQRAISLGHTAELYLIGQDLKLRSNSILDKEMTVLKTEIKTEKTLLWQRELIKKYDIIPSQRFVSIYEGPHNNLVLGIYENIDVFGVRFGIIAEITKQEAFESIFKFRHLIILLFCITALIVIFLSAIISRHIVSPINILFTGAQKIAGGDYTRLIPITSRNEIGYLSSMFNEMTKNLQNIKQDNELHNWIITGQNQLNKQIRGQVNLKDLCCAVICYLAKYLNAQMGAIYIMEKDNKLKLTGKYAYKTNRDSVNIIQMGDGLIGQVALDKKSVILKRVPGDYIKISSGLGDISPVNIAIIPCVYDDNIAGVLELSSLKEFSRNDISFLEIVSESVATAVNSLKARKQEQMLLEQTQVQHEELQQTNEELNKQSAELEEQATQLASQKSDIEKKNFELEHAAATLEEKADDLEVASRYKSEFLANMSHELRTPLNSILLLSRLLFDNKNNNLTEKQIEFADTIHSSGTQLLTLINEILDLAKIESGKIELYQEDVSFMDIATSMEKNFKYLAIEKDIKFNITLGSDLPKVLYTDRQRLKQILKNLLSNAVKFTEKGSVHFEISLFNNSKKSYLAKSNFKNIQDAIAGNIVEFKVSDTGIGISEEKLKTIFEAFKQADGTISRKFGGTGLGLSISLELAKLLGGEIYVESRITKGSLFCLYLPLAGNTAQPFLSPQKPVISTTSENLIKSQILQNNNMKVSEIKENISLSKHELAMMPYDKEAVFKNKKILLVDDDMRNVFALTGILEDKKMIVLIGKNGKEGVQVLKDNPDINLVLMDIMMPVMDGYLAMEAIRKLKQFQHTPVIALTAKAMKGDRTKCIKAGANDYLSKPVDIEKLFSMMRVWLS